MPQHRISYIDVAKGLGILLVVFGHAVSHGAGINKVFWWIYSFHMPLFFFLSGMMFKRKDGFFEKKVTSLIVPTVFCWAYNIVTFMVLSVVGLSGYYKLFNIGTYWFLLALFCISVVYFLVETIVSVKNCNASVGFVIKTVIALVFLLSGLMYSKKTGDTIDIMTASFVGYFYYALGALYAGRIQKVNDVYSKEEFDVAKLKWGGVFSRLSMVCVGIGMLVTVYFLCQFNTRSLGMAESNYGNPLVSIPVSLLGILGFMLLVKGIDHSRTLEWFGKNTIVILLLHIPIIKCFSYAMAYFGISGWINSFVSFSISVIGSVIGVYVVNKHFPIMLGKNIKMNKLDQLG